ARSLVTKVVNNLTAKMEIGAPMVCAYLLGFGDHYTNISFKKFFWSPYVRFLDGSATRTSDVFSESGTSPRGEHEQHNVSADSDRVVIGRAGNNIVPLNKIYDYVYRPAFFSHYCLYDYLTMTDVVKLPRRSAAIHRLFRGHPLRQTHAVVFLELSKHYVLDFIGKPLPRHDKGDREEYCQTMLTFFVPGGWRCANDVKLPTETWDAVFHRTTFAPEHLQIMANMNVLYECRDARDDFAAQRAADASLSFGVDALDPTVVSHLDAEHFENNVLSNITEEQLLNSLHDSLACEGRLTARIKSQMTSMHTLLHALNMDFAIAPKHVDNTGTHDIIPCRSMSDWKASLSMAREQVIRNRSVAASRVTPVDKSSSHHVTVNGQMLNCFVPDSVIVLTNSSSPRPPPGHATIPLSIEDSTIALVIRILQSFSLNVEQERAFRIISRWLLHRETHPLQMYLEGPGGTGKSQVIRAVSSFLTKRGESFRLMLLAPTGSAACVISGSTYHSVLG
ncbi:uncharacterized protein LAESUDRAFT_636206, partial [Laetiporus sulphureus 93-53]